ncbi:MAG: MFS transporter [Gemmataceae bacterium]|nr:MFS transporter [Gemmataceae bacterium]
MHPANRMTSASRIRYQVLLLACFLSALTYLDRACFGVAAPTIVKEFGLDSVADLKWAITAFAIAYGLFEVPTGWWGDRFGPRKVLIRIVLWWSFFTVLTGLAGWKVAGITFGGLTFLIVVRFMFGAGEAGAFPNIARALQNWFPPAERARAQGLVWMSARLMGGLTPLLWTFLVAGTSMTVPLLTWRQAFLVFGLLGLFWCLIFARRFRDRPEQHPQVNDLERAYILAGRQPSPKHAPVPWASVFFQRNLVCLYAMYFCITYGWYFNMTYLPACLERRYGVDPSDIFGAVMKGGPLWLGAFGCLLGGFLTDALLKRGSSLRWSRQLPGFVGIVLCSICYFVASGMPSAWSFALAISLAAFFNDFVIGGAWATCSDVGGKHTAVVAGVLNTAASAGAAIAGWVSGVVLDRALNAKARLLDSTVGELSADDRTAALVVGYETNLLIFAAITAVAAIVWLGANAERRLPEQCGEPEA